MACEVVGDEGVALFELTSGDPDVLEQVLPVALVKAAHGTLLAVARQVGRVHIRWPTDGAAALRGRILLALGQAWLGLGLGLGLVL